MRIASTPTGYPMNFESGNYVDLHSNYKRPYMDPEILRVKIVFIRTPEKLVNNI